MGKKEKAVFTLAEDFQAVVSLVPKLTVFIKAHKEIAEGYQKYRKNGGAAIPGIEKHLGIKEEKSAPSKISKESAKIKEVKVPKEVKATVESTAAKKTKKKVKK
jgi:hypothetical protein